MLSNVINAYAFDFASAVVGNGGVATLENTAEWNYQAPATPRLSHENTLY